MISEDLKTGLEVFTFFGLGRSATAMSEACRFSRKARSEEAEKPTFRLEAAVAPGTES
jgi:hypothetical protein